jgi:hypothetical protein
VSSDDLTKHATFGRIQNFRTRTHNQAQHGLGSERREVLVALLPVFDLLLPLKPTTIWTWLPPLRQHSNGVLNQFNVVVFGAVGDVFVNNSNYAAHSVHRHRGAYLHKCFRQDTG